MSNYCFKRFWSSVLFAFPFLKLIGGHVGFVTVVVVPAVTVAAVFAVAVCSSSRRCGVNRISIRSSSGSSSDSSGGSSG